jgi:hypothetical protein
MNRRYAQGTYRAPMPRWLVLVVNNMGDTVHQYTVSAPNSVVAEYAARMDMSYNAWMRNGNFTLSIYRSYGKGRPSWRDQV